MIALLLVAALQDEPAGLTGDRGGARTRWEESGVELTFRAVSTFQAVVSGGIDGTPLEALSDEDDLGNPGIVDLALVLDTSKAGLWDGGSFSLRIDARAGRSVLSRAGTISAVNLDALIPNVTDRFDGRHPTRAEEGTGFKMERGGRRAAAAPDSMGKRPENAL